MDADIKAAVEALGASADGDPQVRAALGLLAIVVTDLRLIRCALEKLAVDQPAKPS